MEIIFAYIPHEFVNAVDGNLIDPTKKLKDYSKEIIFHLQKSVIGCTLTHYQLWKQLIVDCNNFYIIMEDDITLCDDFKHKIESLLPDLKEKDLCFLGCHNEPCHSKEIKGLIRMNFR